MKSIQKWAGIAMAAMVMSGCAREDVQQEAREETPEMAAGCMPPRLDMDPAPCFLPVMQLQDLMGSTVYPLTGEPYGTAQVLETAHGDLLYISLNPANPLFVFEASYFWGDPSGLPYNQNGALDLDAFTISEGCNTGYQLLFDIGDPGSGCYTFSGIFMASQLDFSGGMLPEFIISLVPAGIPLDGGTLNSFCMQNCQYQASIVIDGCNEMTDVPGYDCIDVSAQVTGGGVAPFSYQWSNGATTQSTQYCWGDGPALQVTVTDANGVRREVQLQSPVTRHELQCYTQGGQTFYRVCRSNPRTGFYDDCVPGNAVKHLIQSGQATLGPCGFTSCQQ